MRSYESWSVEELRLGDYEYTKPGDRLSVSKPEPEQGEDVVGSKAEGVITKVIEENDGEDAKAGKESGGTRLTATKEWGIATTETNNAVEDPLAKADNVNFDILYFLHLV